MASWLIDAKFKEFMYNIWDGNMDFIKFAKEFADKVSQWNKEVFKSIFERKRTLLAKLNGIQRALEDHGSKNLLDLEDKLTGELQIVLTQEELLWYQKERKDLISLGDKNTKIFIVRPFREDAKIVLK